MLGYAPALAITALTSFASVTVFTHWMSQAEYGQYALAINAMTMIIGVCFFWLQSASSRLLPQAVEQGRENQLFSTLYAMFIGCSIALLAVSLVLVTSHHLGDWRIAAWFAAPLAILRALLNLNQSIHRNFIRISRYNIIEIGQSVISLSAAIILLLTDHDVASGAAEGMMIGLAAMSLFDWRTLKTIRRQDFNRQIFYEIMQFGSPFIITYGLSFILSGSDRFLIEYFLGPDQVGIYSAGYAFPDRIGQNLFMAVATASFPLLIRRYEQEGKEAAQDQTYTNGVALLALSIPACVGMVLVNRQIAAVLIGEDFRAGAIMIMPWIAVATVLNGIAAHYFDHAFHLAKKTRLFFYTLGPAAILNFLGNLYAIPRFGIIGAAWTTLAAYALYLVLSILIGRQVFRVKFPFNPAFQIAISTTIMSLVLLSHHFPEDWVGLIEMIVIGAAVYGLGLYTFDIRGLRNSLRRRFGIQESDRIKTDTLHFEILTSISQVEKISNEWRTLYALIGRGVFGGYDRFHIWWKHLGVSEKITLHVVIARSSTGELKAVLPLVMHRIWGVRILEWAGHDVFDYGNILAENELEAQAVWSFVRAHGVYDIALIKDIHAQALSLGVLSRLMQMRRQRRNYYLTLDFVSGDAWLAQQSRKLRGDVRRKTEKMQVRGKVAFHIYKKGKGFPSHVLDALYAQKEAWFSSRNMLGAFSHKGIKGFLHQLAAAADDRSELYLAWLTCNETIVACHMGFKRDGVLYLYHTTYHDDFSEFSPGNSIMIETIKSAIDERLGELDFMRGDEAYKQRFASGHRLLLDFIYPRNFAGKILIKMYSILENLKVSTRQTKTD
jgi:O-antigen/teichoic acid export membrane protein/CelD/BcsL family acetyltransferase involved in cellulose biosynthesis